MLFQKLDGFHSVSKAIQKKSNEIYTSPSKIDHVIYSGFDYKHIPVRREHYFLKTNFVLFLLVETTGKKITDLPLMLIYLLKNRGLIVITQSLVFKKMRNYYFSFRIRFTKKEIIFIPHITQEEVYNQMLEADLFILPSVEEGIANVCIEAMFCKLLVLSTNCGGMSELIEDGITGFLVPTRHQI